MDNTPPAKRVPHSLLRALAFTADMVWKLPPLAKNSSPPLSRYSLALLNCSPLPSPEPMRR